MRTVIFDSSFLIAVAEHPTQWKEDIIDSIGGFEPVMLKCVEEELSRISSGGGKRAKFARVALQLAGGFRSAPSGRADVDDEISSAALGTNAIVATSDRELAKSLRALHVQVVGLRSGRATIE